MSEINLIDKKNIDNDNDIFDNEEANNAKNEEKKKNRKT